MELKHEIDFEQELYKYFGQIKDFSLGVRIAKRFFEMGRQHQEPVNNNLEEANQFIRDCTRTCSNETISGLYESWLTPEQALRAVEIAAGK